MNKILLFLLPAAILIFTGCGKKEKAIDINLSEPADKIEMEIPQNAVRVGIAEIISHMEGFLYYKELLNYIGQKTSLPIVLKQGSYSEINRLFESNGIDVAFICSLSYTEAHEKYGVQLLAVPVIKGKKEYYSYIIVHRDSLIDNFSQIKGKIFAFTDTLSNTGYLFPTFLLAAKNKDYTKYFSKAIFTSSHDNSIIAVAEKFVDAAAVHSLIYDSMAQTDPEIISRTRIILVSKPFGIPPVVVSRNISPDVKQKLLNILLMMHNEKNGREILSKLRIDKFETGNDRMYDSIRRMKAEMKRVDRK